MFPKTDCPSCGTTFIPTSDSPDSSYCPDCQRKRSREKRLAQATQPEGNLLKDQSPLQLGTQGRFHRQPFTLVGRVVREWEGGQWNEWAAKFLDGRIGWLGEAQGFYSMSFENETPGSLPAKGDLAPEKTFELPGGSYTVDDIKDVVCAFTEGELPPGVKKGQKSVSVDLIGEGQAYSNLVYENGVVRLYQGDYIPFEAFEFIQLRKIDGW